MTLKEIKDYLKEEVEFQKEIQISNGDKIYKGFSKDIKIITIDK